MERKCQHSWACASGVNDDRIYMFLKTETKWKFVQKVGAVMGRNPACSIVDHNWKYNFRMPTKIFRFKRQDEIPVAINTLRAITVVKKSILMTRNALEILVVFSLINMVVFFSGVNCRFAMALPQMTIIDLTNSRNCLLLPCYDFSLTYSSYQMQPSKSPKVLKKQEFSIFMSVRLVNQSTVQ